MSKVCWNCPDRKIITEGETYNCHDHCERYADEVRKHRAEKEEREKKEFTSRLVRDYAIERGMYRRKKYKGRG